MIFESFDPDLYEEYIDMETAHLFETMRENPSPNVKLWMKKFTEIAREEAKAEGEARGRKEGEAQGRKELIFAILELRGLDCSDAQRARIGQESEPRVLRRWAERAKTAASAAELFGDD